MILWIAGKTTRESWGVLGIYRHEILAFSRATEDGDFVGRFKLGADWPDQVAAYYVKHECPFSFDHDFDRWFQWKKRVIAYGEDPQVVSFSMLVEKASTLTLMSLPTSGEDFKLRQKVSVSSFPGSHVMDCFGWIQDPIYMQNVADHATSE